jgi:CubicO group peptidase (beta-lactamase class C family)
MVVASAAGALFAQADRGAQVDAICQEWNKPGSPGASVAIIQHGKLLYEHGYGLANLEYNAPVAPDTIFHAASVSKQFTAMALVLLEQDGKLSLEDDIRKYLPELPDYGHRIAIRNLLQHTSGIRDQWQTLSIAGWRMDDVITQQQILRMLFHQKELNFPPGTRHLYSNGGYTLAAEIVARVSGKPFPQFTAERIFRPLGMTRTHFHDDLRRIVPGRAYSYEKEKDGYEAAPLNYANVGATSLFTTAPDLVKWLDNFREPKVGGAAAIRRLEEQTVLADGKKIDYALGLTIGKYRGLPKISHAGGDAGFRSYVLWFPDLELGVAVLSNLAGVNPGQAAQKVAEVYAAGKMTADAAQGGERHYVALDAAILGRYTGYYRLDEGMLLRIVQEDGKLMAGPPGADAAELKPVAQDRFHLERFGGDVEFTAEAGGGMSIEVKQTGGTATGDRVTLTPPDLEDLAGYAGVYWSPELETQYTIFVRDGKLFADHVRHGEIALKPTAKDEFSGSWFMQQVKFLRDNAGRITALTIGGGRVTGIRFDRRAN